MISKDSDIRFHVIHSLSAFALAKIETTHLAENDFFALSELIKDFMGLQGSNHPSHPGSNSSILRDLLRQDLQVPERVPRVLSLMACLIILTDSYVFSHGRTLRLVRDVLQDCRDGPCSSNKSICVIQASVLKCLVWAFGRIPSACRGQSLPIEGPDGFKDKAFLFLYNDILPGLPAAITIALQTEMRGFALDGFLDAAFDPLKHLVEHITSLIQNPRWKGIGVEARRLFLKLLGHPSQIFEIEDVSFRADVLISRSLLDGTLLHAELEALVEIASRLPNTYTELVRPLTRQDVYSYWEPLLKAWLTLANNALRKGLGLEVSVFYYILARNL